MGNRLRLRGSDSNRLCKRNGGRLIVPGIDVRSEQQEYYCSGSMRTTGWETVRTGCGRCLAFRVVSVTEGTSRSMLRRARTSGGLERDARQHAHAGPPPGRDWEEGEEGGGGAVERAVSRGNSVTSM